MSESLKWVDIKDHLPKEKGFYYTRSNKGDARLYTHCFFDGENFCNKNGTGSISIEAWTKTFFIEED